MSQTTVQLQSTALRSATYDDEREQLSLTFASGEVFDFEGIPQDVFDGLRNATSPGRYYHQFIKDQY